ncbi:hypothetical protein AB0E08_07490 [Streptomyces sp. NPDC048281]|uniref:hypothetical protein n=1 Tax=Streptomyces sp. NPDC048281 TaxID=3154715 RepID=UPI003422B5EF
MTTQPQTPARRVQVPPHTDTWMRGDRFGEIVKTGRKYDHVKMDKSGRTLKFPKGTCTPVD